MRSNLEVHSSMSDNEASTKPLGWWTISGEALMDALYRAHDGDDPGLVYLELLANSDVEDVSGE